jgi:hypothetical protein
MTANLLLSLAALAAVSSVGGLAALGQSGKGHQDTILFGVPTMRSTRRTTVSTKTSG